MRKLAMGLAALAAAVFVSAPVLAAEAVEKAGKAASAQTADNMECCKKAEAAGMVCLMCSPDAKATVGKAAPSFMGKDQNGKSVALADYAGKIIVVSWFNPECPVVVRHLQAGSFNKLASEFPKDKVAMLLVDSTDGAAPAAETASLKQNNLALPVVLDGPGTIGHAYNAKNTPQLFVIDTKGKLAYAGAIDSDPSGEKPAAEVTHYAEDAVKALLANKPVKVSSTKPYGCGVHYAPAKNTANTSPAKPKTLAMAEPLCDGGACPAPAPGDGDKKDGDDKSGNDKKDDKSQG